MRLREKLSVTLVLQVIGSLSTLLLGIFVSRKYGADAQGFVSFFNSSVIFVMNIGLFGYPQALVYMLNARHISAGWAVRFTNLYGTGFTALLLLTTTVLYAVGYTASQGFGKWAAVSFFLAAAGVVFHGLYRSIVLSVRSNLAYNIISILPQVLPLAIILAWRAVDYKDLVYAFGISGLLSALLPMTMFGRERAEGARLNLTTAKKLTGYGFQSFITNITASFAILFTYAILRDGGASDEVVGNFSISVLFMNMAVLPLNMVAPVLFNDWAGDKWRKGGLRSYALLAHVGTSISIVAAVAAFIVIEPLTLLVFGKGLMGSVVSTRMILLGGYAVFQGRLLTPLLLAVGEPSAPAIGSSIKMLLIVVLLYSGMARSLDLVALSWIMGETAGMMFMFRAALKKTGWPIMKVAGLSPLWAFKRIGD